MSFKSFFSSFIHLNDQDDDLINLISIIKKNVRSENLRLIFILLNYKSKHFCFFFIFYFDAVILFLKLINLVFFDDKDGFKVVCGVSKNKKK